MGTQWHNQSFDKWRIDSIEVFKQPFRIPKYLSALTIQANAARTEIPRRRATDVRPQHSRKISPSKDLLACWYGFEQAETRCVGMAQFHSKFKQRVWHRIRCRGHCSRKSMEGRAFRHWIGRPLWTRTQFLCNQNLFEACLERCAVDHGSLSMEGKSSKLGA